VGLINRKKLNPKHPAFRFSHADIEKIKAPCTPTHLIEKRSCIRNEQHKIGRSMKFY
jgi:hypothetical protein